MAVSSKLHTLMNIPGASAASLFSDDGKLLAYTGDIGEQAAEIAAMMCAANKLMGNMQAKGWSVYTHQDGFYPINGFSVAGGRYAACIMGNACVFVEMGKADFDKAYEVLSQYL